MVQVTFAPMFPEVTGELMDIGIKGQAMHMGLTGSMGVAGTADLGYPMGYTAIKGAIGSRLRAVRPRRERP